MPPACDNRVAVEDDGIVVSGRRDATPIGRDVQTDNRTIEFVQRDPSGRPAADLPQADEPLLLSDHTGDAGGVDREDCRCNLVAVETDDRRRLTEERVPPPKETVARHRDDLAVVGAHPRPHCRRIIDHGH